MGSSYACTKVSLIAFNVLFWLSGWAILALGMWLKVDSSIVQITSLVQVSMETDNKFLTTVAWLFIGVGIFVSLVGFCGCCGAVRESRAMLSLYMLCLFLVAAGELTGGGYAAVRRDEIELNIRSHGLQWMRTNYNPPEATARAFNYVMLQFKCCGINGYRDFIGSHFANASSTAANTSFSAGSTPGAGNAISLDRQQSLYALRVSKDLTIPKACCRSVNHESLLAALQNANPANETLCTAEARSTFSGEIHNSSTEFNAQGCVDSVVSFAMSHLLMITLVGCFVAAIELFGFAFALCLCRAIEKDQ